MSGHLRVFHALVSELLASADPFLVAGAMLGELLDEIEDLSREIDLFLDDLVVLGQAQQTPLPEADVTEVRRDLQEMRAARHEILPLVTPETRNQCGIAAAPFLAAVLWKTGSWIEVAGDWLESVDRLRIEADAIRGRPQGARKPTTNESVSTPTL